MTLIYSIATFGFTAGFFIWLILYLFVLHQEKGEKFVGWLAGFVAWASKKAERTSTANKIQSKVDSFVVSINTEVEGLLPYGLKVKWILPDLSKEAFIENDRVVVMLNYHNNQDENLSKTTMLYMNKAIIPEARPHIHHKLSQAIDLMMTKKALFSFIEARSSMGHFINTVLKPQTDGDAELKEDCAVIDTIDERGLFTRVFLKELMELGIRRAGVTETGDSVFETSEFTKLLKKIADKERGVNVDPTFIKNNIKMSVIMVARPENVDTGPAIYLRKIEELMRKSVRTFYIFARGDRNIEFAKEVVLACAEKFAELAKGHEEEFPTKHQDGTVMHGYCAIFHNRKAM
jgi:small subunit ribosomal protein S1